jgi:UDP-N-acetylglucosamine:LPS N-acetylglucosamine transferase
MPQREFQAPALARRLFNLLRDGDRLKTASAAAKSIANPRAAETLADLVAELSGRGCDTMKDAA